METTAHTTFKRKQRLGMNIIKMEENEPLQVEIIERKMFVSKNYPDGIDSLEVIDLSTGEEGTLWVDGGMRGILNQIQEQRALSGLKLELNFKGQKEFTKLDEKGKEVTFNVNNYDIFELE